MAKDTNGYRENRLGEYLRARRGLVSPTSVGVPGDGRRRVSGLRREEVAMLAGISSDYYLRLEQGRNRNPSVQVLEAIARVLQLDEPSLNYIVELGTTKPRRHRTPRRHETVSPRITELVGSINLPAFVSGRYLDVLAINPLARVLSPELHLGQNLLRAVFLDSNERIHLDPREVVAIFRQRVGSELGDPQVVQLVGELSLASDAFRKAWARHDIRTPRGGPIRIDHPQVGPMELSISKLTIDETGDQLLVIYHPTETHPRSKDQLALLRSLAAELEPTRRPEDIQGGHATGNYS